jgi:hypothetical protein
VYIFTGILTYNNANEPYKCVYLVTFRLVLKDRIKLMTALKIECSDGLLRMVVSETYMKIRVLFFRKLVQVTERGEHIWVL